MPQITIEINEQQEAKIVHYISTRTDFSVHGGDYWLAHGKHKGLLESIDFRFVGELHERLREEKKHVLAEPRTACGEPGRTE